MAQNYTLGRGKIYFSRFRTGTQLPAGFYYIGNTPEFSLTIESENLDHFSSDEGIREKDDSVPLEVTRTGSMITDNIDPKNVALFFFGTDDTVTQAAVPSAPEIITDVKLGHFYKLGVTTNNPTGYFGVDPTGFSVEISPAGTALTANTDYVMDFDTGMLEILSGGTVAEGDDIEVNYAVRASTRDRVISGSEPVEGAIQFIAHNPKGKNFDYYMPWTKITPNGDYALKGDEWQQIPFTIEALKPSGGGEAIYMDGRPAFS